MNSFNYLRSARPDWLARVLEIRIPERLHAALLGVATAIAVTSGAWGIEAYRFVTAQRIRTAYEEKFDASSRAVQKTRIYYGKVKALVALDQHVRDIEISGAREARILAEVGNSIPGHAWLTSIARDNSGFVLEGRAQNLGLVAQVFRNVLRAHRLQNPTLLSTQLTSDRPAETLTKFVLHLEVPGS